MGKTAQILPYKQRSLSTPLVSLVTQPADHTIARYQLNDLQRKVLGLIQFNAKLGIPEISRLCASAEGGVRYAIQSLKERGIIYFAPLIDHSKLGFTTYSLLFSLSANDNLGQERVRKFLSEGQQVVFASELGGKHQFGLTFIARSHLGVARFIQSIEQEAGVVIQDRSMATHLCMADFRVDYLTPMREGPRSIRHGEEEKSELLDEVDHQILSGISAPAFSSVAGLARELSLPFSTVEYRLKRMEEQKIILAYRNLVCSGRLGAQRLWMTISSRGVSSISTNEFFAYCDTNPFIRYASHAMGSWDFDIGFDAPNAPASATIVQDITSAFGDRLLRLETVPVFKTARYSAYPLTSRPDRCY